MYSDKCSTLEQSHKGNRGSRGMYSLTLIISPVGMTEEHHVKDHRMSPWVLPKPETIYSNCTKVQSVTRGQSLGSSKYWEACTEDEHTLPVHTVSFLTQVLRLCLRAFSSCLSQLGLQTQGGRRCLKKNFPWEPPAVSDPRRLVDQLFFLPSLHTDVEWSSQVSDSHSDLKVYSKKIKTETRKKRNNQGTE